LEKAAFLYVSDVFYDPDFSEQQFELTEGEQEEVEDAYPEEGEAAAAAGATEEEGEDEGEAEEPEAAAAPAAPEGAKAAGPAEAAQAAAAPVAAVEPKVEVKVEVKAEAAAPAPAPKAEEPKPEAPKAEAPKAEAPKAEAAPVPEPAPAPVTEAPKAEVVAAAPVEAKPAEPAAAPAAETKPETAAAVAPAATTEVAAPGSEAPSKAPEAAAAAGAPATGEAKPQEGGAAADGRRQDERGEFRRDRGRRRRRGGQARREARDRDEGDEPREAREPGGQREPREAREPREQREPREPREQREPRDQQRGGGEREERRNGHGHNGHDKPQKKMANIQDLLKVGQEIIVQVAKDPIGTKGARVTSHISLPGRHLVFMPTVDHVGISRRIERESERRRLREIVDRLRPQGTGFIVRTVAENISTEKLEADAKFLISIWNTVGSKKDKLGAPALLHPDLDLSLRATRDLFAQDVDKLVIDDRVEWDRIRSFLELQDPALKERVVLHEGEEPIFDAYGIEHEIQKASQRKVWLKSGGYLIMDQAEALIAIDVNSGRYVGKKSLEETITKINMEAAKEIVYQLRLRNIGGIIIIDFIDMDKSQNRDKVFKALQDALGRDKAKTNVLKISELGLVEMTRKRVRESLGRTLNEPCPYCDGRGHLKSKRTVAYEIFREIRREAMNYKEATLVVNCHPDVSRMLQADERDELRYMMDRFNKSIHIRPQPTYHQEQFDIYGKSDRPQKGREREEGAGDKPERAEKAEASEKSEKPERPERPEQGERSGRGERGGRGRDRGGRGERGDRGDRPKPATAAVAATPEAPKVTEASEATEPAAPAPVPETATKPEEPKQEA
ncbi:MAG TPA: Rne/Rng family ribonuclease, partial [Myxococcales bacterium]